MFKTQYLTDHLKKEGVNSKITELSDQIQYIEQAKEFYQLKRYRRSDVDSESGSQVKRIDVPGDGSCLFWSVTMAYLIPVRNDDALFRQRYEVLFGNDGTVTQNLDHIRGLVRNLGAANYDDTFANLVRNVFRNRVVDHISSYRNEFRDFVEGDFERYLENMRNPDTWGGEPEIRAMSGMLSATISVSGEVETQYGNGNTQIQLFHVGAPGKRNHYNFGLERNIIDNDKELAKGLKRVMGKVRPQDFELIQLLIEEASKEVGISQQDEDFKSFEPRFQSFVDQIPSYLHSVEKAGFFTHFFLGSFSTLPDIKIAEKLNIKKIYFSFDTSKTLKVAIVKNGQIGNAEDAINNIDLFSISEGKRGHQFTVNELENILRKNIDRSKIRDRDVENEILNIKNEIQDRIKSRLVQIYKGKGDIFVNMEAKEILDSATSKEFYEIEKGIWNNPEGDIAKLSDSDAQTVSRSLKKVLEKINNVHSEYVGSVVYDNSAREAAHHGFMVGVFMNFHYRYNLRVYPEQFAGRGYADIILLARGPDRALDSIPIIIELKAGAGSNATPDKALQQAERYAQGFQPNVQRVLTTADNILYVGVNLDNPSPISDIKVSNRGEEIIPLFQDMLKSSDDWDTQEIGKRELKEQIKDNMERIYHTFPGTSEKGDNHYFSRFLLGQSLLLSEDSGTSLKKYIFIYGDNIPTEVHPNLRRLGRPAAQRARERLSANLDASHAVVTMVLIPENTEKLVYVMNIVEANRKDVLNGLNEVLPLDRLNREIGNREIIELSLNFDTRYKSDFKRYLTIWAEKYNSLQEYNNGDNRFQGTFKEVTYPNELKETFDKALDIQSLSIRGYSRLLEKIGEGIFPFKSLVNKEAHFQGILNGVFSYYSDLKLQESPETRALVLTEFQTGRGERIDMLVHGIKFVAQGGNAEEYTPIGLELKASRQGKGAQALLREANDQINEEYKEGVTYKTLTDGDEVKFIGVVFDKGSNNPNKLILTSRTTKEGFIPVEVVHSSVHMLPTGEATQSLNKLNLNGCAKQSNRKKRSIKCLFSKDDVEKFSKGRVDKNNVGKVIIDSEKFLTYVKSSQDEGKNAQLIEFIGNKNIEGDYKYLVDKVIGDQGYERYIQNERIKDLYGDVLQQNSDLTKNPKLKSRLMNAAGGIQLIRGIHGAIVSCKDGTATDCGLNLGGIGWSFASQPIENVMVKIAPKVVTSAEKVVGRIIPGTLGKQTKFVVQVAGVKFGSKIAKGTAGAIAGIFDIIDIGISANNLVDCKNREDSNNPCGEKEIRDNIASIAFSGVSFVSGVALTAASLPGVGIGVGFGLMVTHGVYSGISNIIEYEKKYDTTHGENFDIFLHTLLLSSMPYDLEHLAARNNMVNSQAKRAWKALSDSPNDVVAYGVGFGVDSDTPSLHAGYGKILMNRTDADTTNLSRVIPDPIQNATMICLPQVTSEIYEKGIKKSVPTAVHHCENTMVIADRRRMQNGTIILYNLESIDEGTIVGSNTLNNYFLIFRGNTGITGGNNTVNKFILVKPGGFSGKIIGGSNATNILDLSQSTEYDFVQAKIDYRFRPNAPGLLRLTTNLHRLINDYVDSNVDAFRYSYIGRQNKTDNVLCTYNSRRLTRNDNRDVFINSGGGLSKNEKDTVDNCKKVAIAPYTKVTGAENDYTFYIKTTDYEAKDLYSEIDVKGTGTVIFPETNLLDDCDEISYFSTNNTLSLKIGLGQGNQYTLDIKNYIKQGSNQPNFMLIDKNGSNIIPKIEKLESSITKINSFELHTEHSLDSFDAAENHYKEILINNKDYKVFGVVRAKLQSNSAFQHMVFGSSGEDIINFDQRSMFARGGNGSDMYVIDSNTEKREIIIDNNSGDKKLDMLVMPEVPEEFSIQQCNLHLNYSNTHVQVRNYLKGNSYRHLMVMNSKGETFIPYVQSMSCAGSSVESGKLSPFFHATQTQNMFLLPKDFEGDHLVIDSNLEDIEKYKDEDDLLLTREGEIPFIIRVEDFYNDQSKWRDVNFLLWNNGNFFPYLGLQQEVDGIMDYQDKLKNDYEKIIKEYVIDFTKSISITHNQDGTLTSVGQDEERIGVVILKDITPDQIRVSSSNTDLVFSDEVSNHVINVKNWNNSESYRISTLEFDLGLEPIIIRRLDRFSLSDIAEIQGLINKASEICQKKAGCEANIEAKNNDGQTLFHVAAQEGKLRSIRFLIGKIESMNFEDNLYSEPDELVKAVRQRERLKSLINEKDKFGYTPLQYAAKNGKWDIVNLFLDKTAERNQDDVADKDKFSTSWTTVHYAVYNGNMSLFNDIFQFLSDKETMINTKDSSDWTPLHYAVYYNALDVVKFLVNKGADISVKDKDSKTPLDLAAQENDTNVAEFLKQTELDKKLLAAVQDAGLNEVKDLINQKANINAKDMYGWTLLHFAASRDKLSVVEFLFNNNANINAKDVYGNTPLHVAAQYSSSLEIVKFLLDKDISGINNITNNGWTPLHVAIQGNKLNTVELLLGRGADIEVRDIYNQTSLDLATRKGYLDIAGILKQVQLDRKLLTIVESGGFNEAKGLIAQGANIDTNDKNGNTLLYSAAEIGDLNLVKLLLDNGANIEAKNGEYQATPLHGAVENYRIDVVKLLLNRGANVNAEDKDNWTPLHYGADTNSSDIVKVLVDAHANLGAKGNYGKTPLDIAKDKGHNNIVEYLEKKLRGGRGERKRRHHHGDHNSHNLSRKPLAIDQPQIATSSGAKPSSWINDLFSRVKSSVGRLLSSKSEGTASSLSQVDGQFAKASISNSSFTGTTLPSDGTDKRQENGGFFRDNVDYVNANLKRMCERQAPVKFKPKDRNTILEMGDHYLSQVDFNGTITLFDLLIRRVTGQKYISTIDQSISPLEAQEYTLNITKGFEKVVEQAGLKSGVSMHRLNIDFVEIQKEVTGKIMSGKFDEISGIFNSYVEKACSGKEAGKLSPKKFEKFIAQFNKGLLNQSIEQILHNRDGRLEVDGTKKQQISLEPQSYLSNASVHSHSEVSTCLSEIGVTKLGGNINR
ncbi:ankyrin repeat domain-containing protein [Wolbachia endosymbiont of Oryzaephilus surinamensis]|uniref:ankyrin repeat domain-containing protein n=1 Tax=Wolbachia endosymbiont of Oryzaephilus surinamensis TaxID=573241 RepID=UPI0021D538CA|nr:ankyrin repeat domain-containing protein [Wolbachia endosymbiont of Oryzaephilus surinamensis]UXX40675.1 ankyrin repeat domain-containing protein [Wolbachia endosymbiont of Oryzaephilus surinamensis]